MAEGSEANLRRLPMLAVPGWVLLICLFLPTLRVCNDPMIPLQFPPSYAVYLGGAVVAVIGGARLLRQRRIAFTVLLTLWTLTLFTFMALFAHSIAPPAGFVIGVVLLVLQIRITRASARSAWGERAIAIGCLVHGLIATGWSSLLASDPDGMWGATVAICAGILIVITSIAMISRAHAELLRQREAEPAPLPEARAIVRD